MNNEAEVSIRFKNYVSGEGKLEKYAKTLNQIKAVTDGLNTKTISNIEQGATGVKNISSETEKMSRNVNTAFNYGVVRQFVTGLKSAVTEIGNLTKKSSEYLENINLFQVAFGGAYQEAEKFVNEMSEMYGLDESNLTNMVGIFKQLSNAMNVSTETGNKLSTLLTQMAVDISSLYNIDIERASSVLQSTMAGQTKPIRGATGADITEATLQTTLDTIGIDRYVGDLSYAEKRLLIIISLTDQLSEATNDFSRTIESPANQTRILSEQWERLTRAVGNVFLPIISKVLPYLNAILMVLTEIISGIATLFGYKAEDYDYFAGTADSVLELEEGLDGASESAQKLKSGLRGFDKLNVIKSPSDSSSSASAGGGIDPTLMGAFNDAFDDYNSKLTEASMKATKIRDNIMEWLGFTKLVDEETGDVSFKFDHITGGTVLGALAVGGSIFVGITKIFKTFKSLSGLKLTSVVNFLNSFSGKKSGVKKAGEIADEVNKNTKKFTVPNVKTVLKGMADVALIIGGTIVIIEAVGLISKIPMVEELADSGIDLLKTIFNGIGSIALPLTYMSALMGVMGSLGVATFAKGLADLAIIIGGTTAIVMAYGGLASIQGIQEFASNGIDLMCNVMNGISKILIPVIEIGVVSAGLGALSGVILTGLGVLALVIVGATAVVSAFGGLAKIDGIQEFVNGGIDLMCSVVGGIGKVIGSFVGAGIETIGESVGVTLESFGTHLSNFMVNAQPFFEGIKGVSSDSTLAVKNLASAILTLTATDVLDGLFSWATGESSFEEFGKDLAVFAPYFVEYANAVKDIDADVVNASANCALSVAQFAKEIPNSGGTAGFFAGENDLDKFGEMLPDFGKNFKSYADNISGLDADVVTETSKAVSSVIEFADNIPNSGGLSAWFAGSNNIDDFGSMLPDFGTNMKDYSDNISGIDSEVINNTSKAVKAIVEIADNIPNAGGVASWFTGDNTLSDFGEEIKDFGKEFKEYYGYIKNITIEKANNVNTALDKIVKIFKKVKDDGINKTIKDFGSSLTTVSKDISTFYGKAFNTDKAWSFGNSFGQSFANGLSYALRHAKFPTIKISDNSQGSILGTYKVSAYAQGGLPPVGQLFVANERGPELVGQIGGQSFVANQNQMMDLLDRKIGNTDGGLQNATFIIQVGDEEVAKKTLNKLQDMAKSNGKPIIIGG